MAGLFGGGKPQQQVIPPPAPPPPPPALEDATFKAQQDADALRRRRGRASTLTGAGDQPAPTVTSKQLLGS